MAFYEYVCRDCEVTFELRRSMDDADQAATCPNGHSDVRRKISVFASVGGGAAGAGASSAPMPAAAPRGGGGCCGGGCGCH